MKIVVLDGYTENPGDISWAPLEALGAVTVYDRTALTEVMRMSLLSTRRRSARRRWISVRTSRRLPCLRRATMS